MCYSDPYVGEKISNTKFKGVRNAIEYAKCRFRSKKIKFSARTWTFLSRLHEKLSETTTEGIKLTKMGVEKRGEKGQINEIENELMGDEVFSYIGRLDHKI